MSDVDGGRDYFIEMDDECNDARDGGWRERARMRMTASSM
jgi:hypothetical protein